MIQILIKEEKKKVQQTTLNYINLLLTKQLKKFCQKK